MKAVHWPRLDTGEWERCVARFLSGIWALFWLWFGAASALFAGGSPIELLLQAAAPGLLFLTLAALAWWKEHTGGIVLLLTGLLTLAAYWQMAAHREPDYWLTVGSLLALPPLLSGALFLAASHHPRTA